MPRLVFIDDDPDELKTFSKIAGVVYDCTTVHWPRESAKLFNDPGPDIFVSDLYLPPNTGDLTPTAHQRREVEKKASEVAWNAPKTPARVAGSWVVSL